MPERYWLVLPNGARQLIDPDEFDLASIEERARRVGARLVLEVLEPIDQAVRLVPAPPIPRKFEPPIAAIIPLFRARMERVHACRLEYFLEINTRPTSRVLGGYYRRRRLVRVYSHDSETGRRPLEEIFDTFLHEMAHHLEYTEPQSFDALECERKPGRMHSPVFWQILRDLKRRWAVLQKLERRQHIDPVPDPLSQGTLFDLDA